ncbi:MULTISPECIES: energy transducer TonB [unclassified Polynucleobacter]|jgi:protein TonB|uniref:energy transducer TonB n=1 Tax=unclassified Polynucleobacter TaxID=2640945 RepID=UPI001C0AF44A|nr:MULTISPECIES: energy transducer TonB [unclassified Polynucleobacter]MBU3603465.1 energy transducer TonB [Polynucleobacter sp. AP-Kaivos-20-H2]MBU3617693.1 energy transducer TonB [Polynucleobacter sp. JS-Fieb-80-E5]
MSAFLKKLDDFLPFNKSERIIIGIVVLLHALPALEFLHFSQRPPQMDDERVMANLVSPEASKTQQPPAATPPKPKEEKKAVQEKPKEKPVEKPSPTQAPQQTQQNQAQSKSDAPQQNASVAPATSGGASGTPIQTDIGKLVVAYQPDADAYYPSFSKRSGEQGAVVVRLIIDESGNVEDVALLQSSTFPRLDRAATDIGKRYRFKPFLVNGSPQRISTNLLIKFNLKN